MVQPAQTRNNHHERHDLIVPWFLTDYRANWRRQDDYEDVAQPGAYGAYLWARNFRHAKKVALRRGMGERVVSTGNNGPAPYKTASEMLRSRKPAHEKVHALCFLGQIALASGVATAQEIIGDEGIVHDYCHYGAVKRVKENVARIERITPGYLAA